MDEGLVKIYCPESFDWLTWYNKGVHPADRARNYTFYDKMLYEELAPWAMHETGVGKVATAGCSFGGYHSVNFALKHPHVVTQCISMGGAFDIHQFLDGYYDDNCYFNCPPDFLPNLNDPAVNCVKIVLATGETDICLPENERLSHIMTAKGSPHTLDIWGNGAGHDWPWWQEMVVKFL